MTYEEALEIYKIGQRGWHGSLGDFDYWYANIETATELAFKCLELQIPKRIIDGNFCPRCNAGFGIHWPEWCGNCGQRIDYNLETKK